LPSVRLFYLRLVVFGAVPRLLAGTYLLAALRSRWNLVVLVLIGTSLVASATVAF
jgi:hypothetical protein